jgi:regulatory protein
MSFGRRPRRDGADKSQRSAGDKALALLARREHSQRELQTKLVEAGYSRDEAAAAIARLAAEHYQDDTRFAESLLRSRVAQGYGPQRLRAELKTHGITDARITQLLDAAQVDWTLSAAEQLRRHYGSVGVADRAQRLRRAQFLLRRGFAAATVRSVTQADVDETADPEN